MMPMEPKSFNCGYTFLEKAYREIKEHAPRTGKIIIHMPYWINLFPDNEDPETHLSCINNFMEFSSKYGFRYLVTHLGSSTLGGPAQDECVKSAKSLLSDTLKITKGTDVVLLFENQAQNGLDCRTLIKLAGSINRAAGRKCVGFCFDIEHGYASGEPLDSFDSLIDAADVIHFNPVPKTVKFGSFKDSHNIVVQDSVGIPPEQYVQWAIKYRYKAKIMEQRPEKFVESLAWLKERL